MELADIRGEITKYKAGRSSLLLAIVLSTVNLILLVAQSDFFFLFSFSIPTIFALVGQEFYFETANNLFYTVGVALAAISILVFLACWILSKNHRVALLVAFILLCIDTLIFVSLFALGAATADFDIFYFIELGFRAWLFISVLVGVLAYGKLRNVSQANIDAAEKSMEEIEATLSGEKAEAENAQEAEGTQEGEEVPSTPTDICADTPINTSGGGFVIEDKRKEASKQK